MIVLIAVLTALLLASANGSNDNFKGVATLMGSGTTSFRRALLWGTAATFLGSICALWLAHGLLALFSGQGLVPAVVAHSGTFLMSVSAGAAITVLLASWLGMPISTTHGLMGAMVGAGLVAAPHALAFGLLWHKVALPLLVSPLLAMLLAAVAYGATGIWARIRPGNLSGGCICQAPSEVLTSGEGGTAVAQFVSTRPSIIAASPGDCRALGLEPVLGGGGVWRDRFHFLSAGAVSFARGLNDTPKMTGVLLAAAALPAAGGYGLVAVAIAIGALVGARRVAETLSHRITALEPREGLTANLVTAGLVIGATPLGMPVSTTHVVGGALFGMGTVNGKARWETITNIVLAWVVTLPIAALTGAALMWLGHGGF